jgi:hypothetical protein
VRVDASLGQRERKKLLAARTCEFGRHRVNAALARSNHDALVHRTERCEEPARRVQRDNVTVRQRAVLQSREEMWIARDNRVFMRRSKERGISG